MKASDHFLKKVMSDRVQWVIPVYQRHYSWQTNTSRKQIERIWDDIQERADEVLSGEHDGARPHFVGAIIYEPAKGQSYGELPIHYVVDGQQRLTTFNLYLAALWEVAKERGLVRHAAALEEYLINPVSDAMKNPTRDKFKLWSSLRDRNHFQTLINGGSSAARDAFPDHFRNDGRLYKSSGAVPRMLRAYFHFLDEIEDYFTWYTDAAKAREEYEGFDRQGDDLEDQTVLDALMKGVLDAFAIVVIKLEENDDARGIFESLNGYNEPLTVFDLVRNDIFQRALTTGDDEEHLYKTVWMGIEGEFWDQEVTQGRMKAPRSEHFISHYITAVSGEMNALRDIPDAYREHVERRDYPNIEAEIRELLSFADIYHKLESLAPGTPETEIAHFLKTWDSTTFYPVIILVGQSSVPPDVKTKIYKRLISYLLRRDVVGLTRKNYNKVALSLINALTEHGVSISTVEVWLGSLDAENSRMPSEADILSAVEKDNSYALPRPRLRHILAMIEHSVRSDRQELMSLHESDLHIEHVLPVEWAENWPLPDGTQVEATSYIHHLEKGGEQLDDAQQAAIAAREAAKNSLGNLTILTGKLNREISNGSWQTKSGPEGIGVSSLTLNRQITNTTEWQKVYGLDDTASNWDIEQINARGKYLGGIINKLWPG